MPFQEFVASSDANGTSRAIAEAETEPVGFAVGGEGEDRVASERAVGLGKIGLVTAAVRWVPRSNASGKLSGLGSGHSGPTSGMR